MSKIKLMIEMDKETYYLTRSRIGYWLSNLLNRRTAFPYRLYSEFYEDKRIEECDDCVSRQAVLDIAKSSKSNWIDNSVLFKRVNELPSVLPKREQGEWIGDKAYPICPKCNCNIIEEYISCSDYAEMYKPMKYCPNCGAEMR